MIYLFASILLLFTFSSAISTNKPKIMVHYMPWYVSKPVSGHWGQHWTMGHFDPERSNKDGNREIASHYYPIIGPYDSSDPDLLEYHVSLIKLAGIDGIIIDWYGIEDFYDFAVLNKNTALIIKYARKADLEFAICYEDWTVKSMVDRNHISSNNSIEHGQKVMKYLEKEWFNDELYLKLDGRPVLLNFGLKYFIKSSQWEAIFSVLDMKPHFFTEDHRLSPVAIGAYPWPPMWKSKNGVLSASDCDDYLEKFYQKSSTWDFVIGTAFPGFHDIYQQAGGKSYGYLDSIDGQILHKTLEKAISNDVDIIQIATWNDFGEGTNIEPTREYGYSYLEAIQILKKRIDPEFSYDSEDLRTPKQLYESRKNGDK